MNSRIYVAAVLGGLLALALTLVLVFQFGRHNPSPPSLTETPNPAIPGKILFVNEDRCAVVAEASGASSEEVYCFGQDRGYDQIYWVDAETIAYVIPGGSTWTLVEINISTKQEVSRRTVSPNQFDFNIRSRAPDGTQAESAEGGKLVLVKDGVRTEVADFDVSRYNWPQPVLWSPDSQWLLMHYYPPRGGNSELWIVSRDGQTRGTLTKDTQGWGNAAWYIEGLGSWPPPPR